MVHGLQRPMLLQILVQIPEGSTQPHRPTLDPIGVASHGSSLRGPYGYRRRIASEQSVPIQERLPLHSPFWYPTMDQTYGLPSMPSNLSSDLAHSLWQQHTQQTPATPPSRPSPNSNACLKTRSSIVRTNKPQPMPLFPSHRIHLHGLLGI